MEHTVIFQPSGSRTQIADGTTILEAARKSGVGIEAVCGDHLVCGKCRVKIVEGNNPKFGIESSIKNICEPSEGDIKVLNKKRDDVSQNIRLACSTTVHGDLLVFVPEASRTGKQIVSKAAGDYKIKVKPAVTKYYVELEEPSLDDSWGDFERLEKALQKNFKLKKLDIDYWALRQLADSVRNADWKVTVTLLNKKTIIRIEAGDTVATNLGMAVDIGTTSVAGYLTDLNTGKVVATESMMNPQVALGEDVMSRITHCMLNEETGLQELQDSIKEGLNTLIEKACKTSGCSPHDIAEMVLVGNTAMHHVLLGINPEFMGVAPFPPAIHHSVDVNAERFGLNILPAGNIHVLPNEAGFVGADNVGCLLADEPHKREEFTLLIDIGTNGELVFGNKDKLMSCSSATGPALEGAQIEYGMRAAPGAIEKIKIDEKTFECTYKVIGNENWSDGKTDMGAKGICGSAIIDAVAELFVRRIIMKSGFFNEKIESPRVRKNASGLAEYVIAWKHETSIGEDIVVNQADVRAIQLAKGALYAGCKMMMRQFGKEVPDRLVMAGAFGSHIDKVQAMVMGMIPDCALEKIEYIGNAAGDGARIALVNIDKRKEANDVAMKVEYIELALRDDFNERFGEAMQLPNMVDPFPHVEAILPVEEEVEV
jgi:uncharacterized 2Fe-2S/4Fe-4S cluster protein (DUF4445 family)